MHLPLFIAKRYLFSKKSHNLINVISGVSLTGILVGAMALIIVLSVFNGFESVIKSLYHTFNPDLLIVPEKGKTFRAAEFPFDKLKNIEGIKASVKVIEEDALFRYGDKQFIARIKGVSDNYTEISLLDSAIVDGSFVLKEGNSDFAVLGAGVAWVLGINLKEVSKLLAVYVPKRGNSSSFNLANAFNTKVIHPAGVFSIQQDFDEKYVLTPLRFVSSLLNYNDEITSVEIYLDKNADVNTVQKKVKSVLGEKFSVKNRFQQNATLFKVMKSEKTAIFLILVFILILASFNMIGSVSILIVEKTKDIAVLKSMGSDKKTVKRIFMLEGMLITIIGAAGGLILGAIILFLQQKFSLITLGGGEGAFIINAYPVKMEWLDFVEVFFTVQIIGLFASWYPVKYLLRNFDEIGINR
jgi:lipoprotein-releasing system permease protein